MFILHSRSFTVAGVLILLLLFAGGCKESSTTEPQQSSNPTIVSFTASPTSVPASGDSVTLSWQVNDATSLSISPGVGNVTPIDSGSVKVFVSSETTFTLTASNSAGTTRDSAHVNASLTMTVSGYVKDIDSEPISGIAVIVKGKTPTTTDANGGFSIPDVASPYEVTLINSTAQMAIVYQNLTRSDPTIIYPFPTTNPKYATISGYVPAAASRNTLVFFVSGSKAWSATADQATGYYSISVTWNGSVNSYTGKLQVLRWEPNQITGLPDQYDAYGSEDNLTISAGGTFSNHNFLATDLTDVAEQNIGGFITTESSYSIYSKVFYLNFGDATIPVAGEGGSNLNPNFSYTVPSITGATFEVDAFAQLPAVPNFRYTMYRKKGINGGASGINISLASAPQLNLPANNGTNVDTTTQFLWTKGSGGGVCLAEISPNTPGTGPTYYIITADNITFLPNLSPQGLGLPANTSYRWYIRQVFPLSSIDDAASTAIIPIYNGSVESGSATSENFYFTTHP